ITHPFRCARPSRCRFPTGSIVKDIVHGGNGELLPVRVVADDDGLIAAAQRLARLDTYADDETGAAVLEHRFTKALGDRAGPNATELADEIFALGGRQRREQPCERPYDDRGWEEREHRGQDEKGDAPQGDDDSRGWEPRLEELHAEHRDDPGEEKD